jgi:hypothetical protein
LDYPAVQTLKPVPHLSATARLAGRSPELRIRIQTALKTDPVETGTMPRRPDFNGSRGHMFVATGGKVFRILSREPYSRHWLEPEPAFGELITTDRVLFV